jgi:hypothetical protein
MLHRKHLNRADTGSSRVREDKGYICTEREQSGYRQRYKSRRRICRFDVDLCQVGIYFVF